MAAEWGWNPEAVGAIGGAASATAAVIAAIVACVLPSWLQKKRERKRATVASVVLWLEIEHLAAFAKWLLSESFVISAFNSSDEGVWISSKLQCPLLKEYLDAIDDLPLDLSVAVGNTYSLVRALDMRLCTFSRGTWMDAKKVEIEKAGIADLTQHAYASITNLQKLLELHSPARNRSVSYTPSDTPESMQIK
ncbi:MAG: hypothetical protein RR715_03195 [Comamonas sp.]